MSHKEKPEEEGTLNGSTSPVRSSASSSGSEDEIVDNSDRKSSSEKGDLIPVPPEVPKSGVAILSHKIWIGNLDKRLTEQNILQFVTPYGTVVGFRYLFRSASTDRPEPREYCFVEYSTREEAEKAKAKLHGKKALGKKIIVDWARQDQGAAKKNPFAVSETWDASSVSETLDSGVSTSAKIAALEAKLRQMEEESEGGARKRPKLSAQDQIQHVKRKQGHSSMNIVHRPSKPTRAKVATRSFV